MIRALALAAMLAAAGAPAAACRLALALGLDVSASVDAREYRLQLDGLAAALNAPPVREALLGGGGGPVALAVFEWSGWADQRLLLDWTLVTGPDALAGVTARLLGAERQAMSDSTALGQALLEGGGLLARGPGCWRKVLDVSGDGRNNDGPDPDMLDGDPVLAGVTVNALVIGAEGRGTGDLRAADIGELSSYFQADVIRGPGAFVQVALGFDDYERAMTRKLLREVAPAAMSALE
ncbi:MAG TPA: DUF1194 domain-containing protein [Woeseiaceae bacterium]|nr:DUF1194 domain-containing protein [Woeseiaceae bacterium]